MGTKEVHRGMRGSMDLPLWVALCVENAWGLTPQGWLWCRHGADTRGRGAEGVVPAASSSHYRVLTGSFLKDHRSADGWPSLPQEHSKASRNFCEAVAEALLSHSEFVSPTTGHAFTVLA